MALIYPEYSEAEIDAFDSHAESKVYRACRDQLPDKYLVFHSLTWIGKRKGAVSDFEADLVIFHPDCGVLTIEVKGGSKISKDPKKRLWYSTNRKGRHEITNPFFQAKENKYGLRDYIRTSEHWQTKAKGRFLSDGHAVLFPDISDATSLDGPDSPGAITGCGQEIGDLKAWVRKVMDFWRKENATKPIGEEGMEAIKAIFAEGKQARLLLSQKLEDEEDERVSLTKEQSSILQFLGCRRRVAIRGGAGTGKTLIAFQKARQLAASGTKTLFLCYNNMLGEHLDRVNEDENLLPMTFHKLCEWRIREAIAAGGVDLKKQASTEIPQGDYYDDHLPHALALSTEILEERFDAIIIDEGQDFKESFWFPLQLLLQDDEQSFFYIFYDENQAIYEKPDSFPIEGEPFDLTRNCRNTRNIFEAFNAYYEGPPVEAPAREGNPVRILEAETTKKQVKAVRTEIVELIEREGVAARDITVICLDDLELYSSLLRELPLPKGISWLEQEYQEDNCILIDTARRFKGMEAKILFILGWVKPSLKRELLYVTLSRAKSMMYLVGQKAACEKLLKAG